jgi:hypothetical protein
MGSNTTGSDNVAQGYNTLLNNTTGSRNSAVGRNALGLNSSGFNNVALGFNAGYNQTTGHDDIYIASLGVAAESQTLRLGSQGVPGMSGITNTYVAGIVGSPVTGSAVYVSRTGQLGVLASSERYKLDVASMGASTNKLSQLRPVTFKLKNDPQGTVQYGLIAEEVDRVYPELVIHNAEGRIEGVRYEELAPMLLNEVQQQRTEIADQRSEIVELKAEAVSQSAQIAAQAERLREMQQQMAEVRELGK